jgi:hypothetical protein
LLTQLPLWFSETRSTRTSATRPLGFSIQHTQPEIRTVPTSAKQRGCQFTLCDRHATSERRTSDESPIKNFTAVTQLDIGAVQAARRSYR